MTITRERVRRVCRLAVRVAPAQMRDWADAMVREIEEIECDRAALKWASGCLRACIAQRARPTARLAGTLTRLALAVFCIVIASRFAGETAMLVAFKTERTEAFAALAPMVLGEDYLRFTPLLEALPVWQVGASALSTALFVGAAALIVLRRSAAGWAILAAALLNGAMSLAGRNSAPIHEVLTAEELRAYVQSLNVVFGIMLAVAAAMFLLTRRREDELIV